MKPDIGPQIYAWTVHPAAGNKKMFALALVVSAVFFLFVLEVTESVFVGLVILLVYLGTLKNYFFPSHFRLCAHGVEKKQLGMCETRRFAEFHTYFVAKRRDAILLSTRPAYGLLARTRGLELLFPDRETCDRVETLLQEAMGEIGE